MTWLKVILLFSTVVLGETVSLEKANWLSLAFSKIKPNQVSYPDGNLQIAVQNSAGPVIYKLPMAVSVSGFHIKGRYSGAKRVETSVFDEDSILRFGVVTEGQKTLSGFKRWFAADWVKKLFQLAPAGAGIDRIHFFNVTNRQDLLGKQRVHPQSELIIETIVLHLAQEGEFDFNYKFKEPLRVVAVWLSVDGDDSKSTFTTTVSSIEIKH